MSNVNAIARNGLLEAGLVNLANPEGTFIADALFHTVPVQDKKGVWFSLDGGFGAATPNMDYYRSPGAAYPEVEVKFTEQTGWNLNDFGLGWGIDKKDARYSAGPATRLDLQRSARNRTLGLAMLRREMIAAASFTASTWTQGVTLSGTDQFSDPNSDVIARADTSSQALQDAVGLTPNAALMSARVAAAILRHPQIVGFYSQTRESIGRVPDQSKLAAVLGVERVYVGRAFKNTANSGQTQSLSQVWGNHLLFFYDQLTLDPESPQSAMARYQLEGGDEMAVRTWDDGSNPLVERGSISWDEQFLVPRPTYGYLLTNAIA